MKRRSFLKNSIATGAILSVDACQSPKSVTNNQEPAIDDFPLNEITIKELLKSFENEDLTCEKVTHMYLERIEKIDKNGPNLNSVIEINPDALSLAMSLDEDRKNGKIRGPLHHFQAIDL